MRVLRWVVAAALALILLPSAASAATLFQDDFESYPAGTNLIGEGGWTTSTSGSSIAVAAGAGLSTNVATGRVAPTALQQNTAQHDFAVGPGAEDVVTLTFDALASTGGPRTSHNDGFGFQAGGNLSTSWWCFNDNTGSYWDFIDYLGGATPFRVNGFFDVPGHFTIVLDPVSLTLYGSADFGPGNVFDTPHTALTAAEFVTITGVGMYQEGRVGAGGLQGMEVDDILAQTPAPEPSAIALALVGAAWLLCRRLAVA